jgi:hypothetical protein
LHHYFTPKRSIIKTESTIDKDSDLTMAQMFDGTAVRIPTEIIEENYQEVHINDELEIDHEQMAKGYAEMSKINLEEAQVAMLVGEEANNSQMKVVE